MKDDDSRFAVLINSIGLFWFFIVFVFYCSDRVYQKIKFFFDFDVHRVMVGFAIAIGAFSVLIFTIRTINISLFVKTKKTVSISMAFCFFFMAMWEVYFNMKIISADGALVIGVLFTLIFYVVDEIEGK